MPRKYAQKICPMLNPSLPACISCAASCSESIKSAVGPFMLDAFDQNTNQTYRLEQSLGKMITKIAISLLVAAYPLAFSAPLASSGLELRLIKTSETDVGQWMTEKDKFDRFISKNIGFIDITDIKVSILKSDSLSNEYYCQAFFLKPEYRTTKCYLFYPPHLQKRSSLLGRLPIPLGSST